MKIKFNLDDELPLNKTVEIPSMVVFVRAIFLWKSQILFTSFLRWIFV